jgi:hypothetical protein
MLLIRWVSSRSSLCVRQLERREFWDVVYYSIELFKITCVFLYSAGSSDGAGCDTMSCVGSLYKSCRYARNSVDQIILSMIPLLHICLDDMTCSAWKCRGNSVV